MRELRDEELEEAVVDGQFLQETYRFDPTLIDSAPGVTVEEEELGRSGKFTAD